MGDTAKQFSLQNFRPEGFEYPIGLSSFDTTVNLATNTTGGTQTIDGDNAVHSFTSSDNFIPSFTGNVEYLLVAAGGSGGAGSGGGGGAGGLLYSSGQPVTSGNPWTITIGAGGVGYPAPGQYNKGTNGNNSVIVGIATANGGGAGGAYTDFNAPGGEKNGNPGGSGGGGAGHDSTNGPGGSGIPSQGSAGGNGGGSGPNAGAGGGGGGAGGAGVAGAAPRTGGDGGVGLSYSISGSSLFYAGGGGGGGRINLSGVPTDDGEGGSSIGGNAVTGPTSSQVGDNGVVNRGSGGGSGSGSGSGGSGSSGIAIIRYNYVQNTIGYFIN